MSLQSFFAPKSVAIVGASRQKGKVGYEILVNMISSGFEGKIWPVNRSTDSIEGLTCYPDLTSIGQTPELVIVIVPAKSVLGVIEECAKIGTKAVIIITAGFKEVGEEGKKLEDEIVRVARRAGIRIIGPNCLGVTVTASKLNASFGGDLPEVGGIGYLSQSGALLAAILDIAKANGIGFSSLFSIGNKADVDELDLVEALAEDPNTTVIAGYLENIKDGNAFVHAAEKISHEKPILLMKSGGTAAGARAASSHTGSLAGSEVAYEAMFARAGIIRCDSITQQFDFAQAFANQPLPQGPSVVILTNAGGAGIMAADAIEREGLTFAKLSPETIEKLKTKLPPAANFHNPVDVLGDALADRYEFALDVLLDDPNVETVLVLLTPQAMTEAKETAEAIVRMSRRKPDKPILACFMGASKVAEGVKVFRQAKIPQYDSPEAAVATIKAMADYVRWRARPKRVVRLFPVNRRKVESIIERHLRQGAREIGEAESKEILEAYGFATPNGSIATTPEQAANIAEQLGYPVVLKIWSPDIVHKSDVGGVKVGLKSAQEVKDAFDLMMYRIPKKAPQAHILGVLVQEMCSSGREVILGMHRDPHFGPLMMFGMGGIMVEVLKDVAFYLAPLTEDEAKQMLMNTKTYQLLKGVRGQEGVDIEVIAEGLQRLSQLVTEFPQIQEMDINPYVVGLPGTTPIAVDARISVEK
ncbi:MAG TPA: acetate--CoA ligase family protein [Sedimentisphaerales bacterium]|nr:acetate--CoA ligase family protein [Sedimentisphaerales bacterium]HRS09563.1 acetate--CoA ligase family protein [Sedimentisphaerales bacterium]HRS09578.1 acetate--CoA ligase family protein [Sedimentisphaerales bacterium]HRV46260.1 acetate--CoA ligase family protein [Sedimentisphaerales bacterium]